MTAGSETSFAAVVLAGGHSRRMGSDKAWIQHPVAGEPLVLRQLTLLATLQPAALLVSARAGQSLPELPPSVIRVDDDGQAGPMAGIAAALESTNNRHLLVVAVDLPGLEHPTLAELISHLQPDRGVITQSPHGLEPLIGIYPRALLPDLQSTLKTETTGLQRWLNLPHVKSRFSTVTFEDPAPFQNWNHPDQIVDRDP